MSSDDGSLTKMAGSQRRVVVPNSSSDVSRRSPTNSQHSELLGTEDCTETDSSFTPASTVGEFTVIQPPLDHSYVYSEKTFNRDPRSFDTDDSHEEDSRDSPSEDRAFHQYGSPRGFGTKGQVVEHRISEYQEVSTDGPQADAGNSVGASNLNGGSENLSCVGNDANYYISPQTFQSQISVTSADFQEVSANASSQSPAAVDSTKANLVESATRTSDAPLGSSQNPIQIIQQGNAFRSTQLLSKEQLQQIAQVLQQQQLSKAIQNGGKSVLYDETTNTRIVYRVIYPSELQKKASSPDDGQTAAVPARSKGRPRKSWSKRASDEEKGRNSLSKEEREEKKKHRPRTRSGRISKPPSYMVKDYKRIHHLDFNEEPYDDSDGGYSDYHVSDEEIENSVSKGSSTGVTTSKQRNYSCASCSKAYIGKGGLSRHYRLNPSHGSLQEGEDVSTQDENSNSSAVSVLSSSKGNSQGTSNVPHVTAITTPCPIVQPQQQTVSVLDLVTSRRRNKLKEILKSFTDEELAELALPRICHAISPWDFMLLKSREDGHSHQLSVSNLFLHFESLLLEMQKLARSILSSTALADDSQKAVVHITNEEMAKALSVNRGTYFVKDLTSYQVNNLNSNSSKRNIGNVNPERTVMLSPEDVVVPPVKQRKVNTLHSPVISAAAVSSDLPAQILNEEQETGAIGLNLPSGGYDGGSVLHEQDPSQLLNAIQDNTATNLSDFSSQVVFDCNGSIVPGIQKTMHVSGHSTTVTPSSLSSGCLSAVDSSDILQNQAFISPGSVPTVQALENVQLQEVPLFSSALQNFQSAAQLQGFVSSGSSMKITDESGQQQILMSDSDRGLLVFDNVGNGTNQCPLPEETLQGSSSSYCDNIRATSVDYVTQPPVTLFNSGVIERSPLVDSLSKDDRKTYVPEQAVQGCLNNTDSVQCALENSSSTNATVSANCEALGPKTAEGFQANEKYGAVNMVSLDVQTSQVMDGSSMIRQLVLPDGRVIGTWSPVQNQTTVTYREQFAPEHLLPGNLILVQNQDGSYQVPNEQVVSPETLQALMNAGQILISQEKEKSSLI